MNDKTPKQTSSTSAEQNSSASVEQASTDATGKTSPEAAEQTSTAGEKVHPDTAEATAFVAEEPISYSGQPAQSEGCKKPAVQKIPLSKTAVLSLLISATTLGVIGVGGWYGYQTILPEIQSANLARQDWVEAQLANSIQGVESSLLQKSGAQVAAVQQDVQGVNDQFRIFSQKFETVSGQYQDVSDQSGRLVSRLDHLDRKVSRLQESDRNEWMLAEAEYLMRLANQRLLTVQDLKSAQTLLIQADELLVALDEYALFNVRQALAEDIASVRSTSSVDVTSPWLKLDGFEKQIDKLPLRREMPSVSPEGRSMASALAAVGQTAFIDIDAPSEPVIQILQGEMPLEVKLKALRDQTMETLGVWGHELANVATDVSKTFAAQFTIRKDTVKLAPALMAPEQDLFLRQNLRLMVEQAQIALLQRRAEVYRGSLANIQQWLDEWFVNDTPEMVELKQSLQQISNTPLAQPIPDISRSMTALKGYVNEKVSQKSGDLQ